MTEIPANEAISPYDTTEVITLSDIDYTQPPANVQVPLIRNWFSPALRVWAVTMFPPRRRAWFAWGWVLLVILAWKVLKFYVWLAGYLVLLAAFLLTASYDLLSYHWRKNRAAKDAYQLYMEALYREGGEPA